MTVSLKIHTKGFVFQSIAAYPNAVEMLLFETKLFGIPGKEDLESDKTTECQFGVVFLLCKPIKKDLKSIKWIAIWKILGTPGSPNSRLQKDLQKKKFGSARFNKFMTDIYASDNISLIVWNTSSKIKQT